jgi:hypothetical protein
VFSRTRRDDLTAERGGMIINRIDNLFYNAGNPAALAAIVALATSTTFVFDDAVPLYNYAYYSHGIHITYR